jgi:repressor LexA
LTDRENEIYSAIKNYILNRGYPPTVREIGQLVGLKSTSTVHRYLVSIQSQGYIAFEPNQPRTLRVLNQGH